MTEYLGIDVGGSGIKAALVDSATGELLSDRHRVETRHPSTPAKMSKSIRKTLT